MSSVAERAAGVIVRKVVPGEMLLMSRLGEWYEKNESHKYREGDVLMLRRPVFGFGVRPVAEIQGYDASDKVSGGFYLVTMHADLRVDPNSDRVRVSLDERHFKWNMENLFRKVPRGLSPDEALSLYRGKKATWGA